MVEFQQAPLAVEKVREFGELKGIVNSALSQPNAKSFLKMVEGGGFRIRGFDAVLKDGIFDRMQKGPKGSALKLYEELPVSDQAQVREFYLSKIEEIEPELRTKFQKLYSYY